ncbi:MAG: hypothetical protein U1E29_13515 [Coriobacteriia bacterium]|nr:hypothetical protein [Coriobacteriia bacterium]
MNLKKLAENLSAAMVAQTVGLTVSIVGGLLVPKALGVEEFGYWQLFIFYASYVGFFHLGLNDGVYLVNNGKTLDEMDKSSTISQFKLGLTYQAVFAGLIVGSVLVTYPGRERTFVLIMTAACLLIGNTIDYFGYVFQAANETRRYSQAIVIGQLLYFVSLVLLLALGVREFEAYVLCFVLAKICALGFTLYHARSFLAARPLPFLAALSAVRGSIGIGSKLMIANIAAALTVGVVRFVIDDRWDIVVFGKVSFALSLATMLLAFVSQISMVLSPALRHSGAEYVVRFYTRAKKLLDVVLPSVYLMYFPVRVLVGLWLPRYEESLLWFAVFLPMCVFNARTTVMSTTYYRVLRKERDMLAVNVGSVAVSGVCAAVGGYVYHSLGFVVGAAVVAGGIRSIVSEVQLSRYMNAKLSSMMLGQVLIACVFVACLLTTGPWTALLATGGVYAAYLVVYGDATRDLVRQAQRLGRSMYRVSGG